MGLTTAGAGRFLAGVIGSANSSRTRTLRLHTSTTPSSSNELSGNGYQRVTLSTGFTYGSVSGYRELRFPSVQWFSNAGSSAQRVRSVALWHSSTLVWFSSYSIRPTGRVYADAGDVVIAILAVSSSLAISSGGIDAGLFGLSGGRNSIRDMYWELHSGIPSSSNRLTGGGIDGVRDVEWITSTVQDRVTLHNWRRITQNSEIEFSDGLTADTNREPTHLGLWRGRPEARGVRHAYWPLSGLNRAAKGSSIVIPRNTLYLEVEMDD